MDENETGMDEFKRVTDPVIKYLAETHYQHYRIVITSHTAEMHAMYAVHVNVNDEYIPD